MDWLKRHALVIGVAVVGLLSFALFAWREYGYFCDQNSNLNELREALHMASKPCEGFWSSAHMNDLLYNAASNWQSECFFGILLLVMFLKLEGPRGADKGDT
jgi:hypothetical protein